MVTKALITIHQVEAIRALATILKVGVPWALVTILQAEAGCKRALHEEMADFSKLA